MFNCLGGTEERNVKILIANVKNTAGGWIFDERRMFLLSYVSSKLILK